jgi:hypothetical protein
MKKLILFGFMISIFIFSKVFGQIIPDILYSINGQKEIIQKTMEFDSLVLIDKTSYWMDDLQMNGFGFKNNETYKVKVILSVDGEYDFKVKKINKSKLTGKSKIDNLKNINYSINKTFSNDSLNLKTRTKTERDISDQDEWTILILKRIISF